MIDDSELERHRAAYAEAVQRRAAAEAEREQRRAEQEADSSRNLNELLQMSAMLFVSLLTFFWILS
jgi:hypothetical protein